MYRQCTAKYNILTWESNGGGSSPRNRSRRGLAKSCRADSNTLQLATRKTIQSEGKTCGAKQHNPSKSDVPISESTAEVLM